MRWLPRGLDTKAPRRGRGATAPALFRTSPNPYLSVWDPDRAVNEALTRVTWVFRCVDAIAGNAAKIPFVMRRNDAKDGPEVPNHPLNLVMNSQANIGEDSFSFRYRLSSQLLLSSRGVFIEIVRNNAGEPIAFVLLPPQYTKPIPDPKTFVSGYEVSSSTFGGLPGPNKVILPPDRVLWLRRPHPMDPYGSLTPLEAAGLAVESDWLARLYNRNFMLNDGRPGGLIVIKGVVTEEDKEELRARYRGNVNTAGRIGVLSSDEGADFVDTAVHPRDMQYNELRSSTRDEINSAFGVDQAVLGNVAGRCLSEDEYVRLASGERYRAGDLIGKYFTLLTSGSFGQRKVAACASEEQTEECYRVTTSSGRQIEVNARHPLFVGRRLPGTLKPNGDEVYWLKNKARGFYSIQRLGFTPVKDIGIGKDWLIAVPSVFTADEPAESYLSVEEAGILGHLIGDGRIQKGGSISLTTPEGPQSRDFIQLCEVLGDKVRRYATEYSTGGVATCEAWGVSGGVVRRLCEKTDLIGKTCHTKRIPDLVWSASRRAQAAFLNRYFAADGCATLPKAERSARIILSTASGDLARDTQELLLRFGINSSLHCRKPFKSGFGKVYAGTWMLTIARAGDIDTFATQIGMVGKEEALDAVHNHALKRLDNPRYRSELETLGLGENPDLRWEWVKSIEPIGVKKTVGIQVFDDNHAYLSTVYEHNTFDNAEMARLTFWMETMTTHLELIARPLDKLDTDPKIFAGFDISGIDVLQRAEIKRRDFLLKEVSLGARVANEYRTEVHLPKLAEGGETVHIQNTYGPVGGTKKGEVEKEQKLIQGPEPLEVPPHSHPGLVPAGQGAPGAKPPGPGAGRPERTPNDQNGPDPETPPVAPRGTPARPRNARPVQQAASVDPEETRRKHLEDQFKAQMSAAYERWELIYERALQRLFERQERVVLEKINGPKATKRWGVQADISDLIFDQKVYTTQIIEDILPIWSGIVQEFLSYVDPTAKAEGEAYEKLRKTAEADLKWVIQKEEEGIRGLLASGADVGDDISALSEHLRVYFDDLKSNYAIEVAHNDVNRAGAAGMALAGKDGEWMTLNGFTPPKSMFGVSPAQRKALYIKSV